MLCVKKHSHAQWRDFKMNVLVCDDDRKIVDRSFIVEPVFKEESSQTLGEVLLRLMKSESEKL